MPKLNSLDDLLKYKTENKDEHQYKIVSKDVKSKASHTAINVDRNVVKHYNVDGTIYTDSDGMRVDYLLLNMDKKVAYFIELKGSNIEHGIEQLEQSDKDFKKALIEYQKEYRLVFTGRTHNGVNGPKYRKAKSKWGSHFNSRNGYYEEHI